MNYYLTKDGCLMHHGIEGQKWGKRNGPPYPLDASQASASEKKKGFRESRWTKAAEANRRDGDSFKGHENGIYSKKGKLLVSKEEVRKMQANAYARAEKYQAKADRLAEQRSNSKSMNSKTKKAIAIAAGVGVAVGAAALATYGTKKVIDIKNEEAYTGLKTAEWFLAKGVRDDDASYRAVLTTVNKMKNEIDALDIPKTSKTKMYNNLASYIGSLDIENRFGSTASIGEKTKYGNVAENFANKFLESVASSIGDTSYLAKKYGSVSPGTSVNFETFDKLAKKLINDVSSTGFHGAIASHDLMNKRFTASNFYDRIKVDTGKQNW